MTEIGNTPNLIGGGIEKYSAMDITSKTTQPEEMRSRLESIGKEFEGVFLSLMLKEMRNTLEGGGFFGEETSDTYGGMFDMFVGQDLAESSPLGIAEMLANTYAQSGDETNELTEAVKSVVASVKYLNAAQSTANESTNSFTV